MYILAFSCSGYTLIYLPPPPDLLYYLPIKAARPHEGFPINQPKTLHNIFFSLSLGLLPICRPQRDKINDSQWEMVGKNSLYMQTVLKVFLKII